jgi:hypothetical protein
MLKFPHAAFQCNNPGCQVTIYGRMSLESVMAQEQCPRCSTFFVQPVDNDLWVASMIAAELLGVKGTEYPQA